MSRTGLAGIRFTRDLLETTNGFNNPVGRAKRQQGLRMWIYWSRWMLSTSPFRAAGHRD